MATNDVKRRQQPVVEPQRRDAVFGACPPPIDRSSSSVSTQRRAHSQRSAAFSARTSDDLTSTTWRSGPPPAPAADLDAAAGRATVFAEQHQRAARRHVGELLGRDLVRVEAREADVHARQHRLLDVRAQLVASAAALSGRSTTNGSPCPARAMPSMRPRFTLLPMPNANRLASDRRWRMKRNACASTPT
jgi:hypothetical protein